MRALNIAATGMAAQNMRVEVISHNLANMNTTAYNARRAEFSDLHYQQIQRPGTVNAADGTVLPAGVQLGLGVRAAAVSMEVQQGSLDQTGGSLDLGQGRRIPVDGSGAVHGLEADLSDVGELAPALTAVAALADSPSHFYGISHLRGHETDRLAALATEINGLGGDVTETQDGLRIEPRPLHSGDVRTYSDHRMATAAAILGLRVAGLRVEDIDTTAKTLPDFARRWQDMVDATGSAASGA